MQSRQIPQKKFLNKVTNPNFMKTPPPNLSKTGVMHTASVKSLPNKVIVQKVKSARINSVLNLANMNLDSLPEEIFDENIKFDDINWWEMVDIKKVDATNNKISSESFESNADLYNFAFLPGLNYLKFSFNMFTTIPDSIFTLNGLKYLDFSNNKLTSISSGVRNLKSLVEFNLSGNLINSIPEEIGYLGELEIFNLSINRICEIPKSIANLSKMKRFDCSENLLTHLPIEINKLYLLEDLILFKNKITSTEGANNLILEGLTNLKYLDLHNNYLVTLSNLPYSEKLDTIIVGYNRIEKIVNLKNCPNLSVLDVNNNKISNFPEEVLFLKVLKTLNLMNNSLNDVPPQLCFLRNLVRINLEGNPLKKINSKYRASNAENLKAYLKNRLTEEDLKGLVENKGIEMDEDMMDMIDINSNPMSHPGSKMKFDNNDNFILNYFHNNSLKINSLALVEVPFDQMKKNLKLNFLVSLDFSNNKINSLQGFENFADSFYELKEIKFSFNKINYFPEFFLNFYNLKIIEMKNNLLSSFLEIEIDDTMEGEIVNILPNLEYLDLSSNKFKAIPQNLKYLKNLSVLLMSNNTITDISNLTFSILNILDTLDLGTNKIEGLPSKLYKNCPNLKILNIENNDIKFVPTDLCLIPSLNKINLGGNPIKMLRSNIIGGGTKMIMEYLRKMHKFDQEDLEYDEKISANMNLREQNQNGVNTGTKLNNNFNLNNSKNKNSFMDKEDKQYGIYRKEVNDLDRVNEEILQVETELANSINMPMYKKADLRKQLNSLIRQRANLLKK